MDSNAVRRLLRAQIDQAGSLRKWARANDGDAAFACRVVNGEKEPSDTILAALGLERVVAYRKRDSSR